MSNPPVHPEPQAEPRREPGVVPARRLPPIPAPIDSAAGSHEPDRDLFGRAPVGYPDWSHRRGEPRVFALIWMLFLMCVTMLMFASFVDAVVISQDLTRPAGRRMILATVLGIALLWPAIRLSQRRSHRPVMHVARDLFVVMVPAQAVVWPHAMTQLAGWPIGLLLALSSVMFAWGLVVGGVIALADAATPRVPRWMWMLVVLGISVFGPVLSVVSRPVPPSEDRVRVLAMMSPATAILELTRARPNASPLDPVPGGAWRLIGATGCFGGALLLLARSAEVASRRRGR